MQLINTTNNCLLASEVELANHIFKRLKGLLGKEFYEPQRCMLFIPGNSIHTFFMRFPIDVLFLDKHYGVIKAIFDMKPGSISPVVRGARYIVEMASTDERRGLVKEGDQLQLVKS